MESPGPLLSSPVLRGDLDRVEQLLRSSVESEDPFLTELASHLVLAGGKRVRPSMAIVAAATASPEMSPAPDDVVRGAVAVELVHLGSLYHDDVMDDAQTRRTVESVNARWGNLKAILAGDFLLARASGISADIGTEVARLLAATIARLCEGQVLELQHTFDPSRSEPAYLSSIAGKTAALLSSACRIGAICGGLPSHQVELLTTFGQDYGMAFQIVDDVLDLVATEDQLGKPAGHDMAEGVYTLPVIRTLTAGNGSAERLRNLLAAPLGLEALVDAREIVRDGDGVDSALRTARSYADSAMAALDGLPDGEATDALRSAADHLLLSATAITP